MYLMFFKKNKVSITGLDLVERLLKDINTSINLRSVIPDPRSCINFSGFSDNTTITSLWPELNVEDFDKRLDMLSEFINSKERLVEHDKGAEINIFLWKKNITENKRKISEILQQFLDNQGSKKALSEGPLAEFVIKQLNGLHESCR